MEVLISRVLTAALVVLGLSACGTTLQSRAGFVLPANDIIHIERNIANVGDYMSATVPFIIRKGLRISEDLMASANHRSKNWKFTAPAGTYLHGGQSEEGDFYFSGEGLASNTDEAFGGLFVPKGSSFVTEILFNWHHWSITGFRFHSASIDGGRQPVVIEEESVPVSLANTKTLSYIGLAGGQIRFVYREFTSEGLARSAFTQEVEFDYKPGETYGFGNARFIVHDANTTQITYTIISHL